MITERSNPWLSGFTRACRPPDRSPLADVASREVHLVGSQYGPRYSIGTVPAHRIIFDWWEDPSIYEIANIAPTGFGKTTVFEVCISKTVADDPGDTLIIGSNQKNIKKWMESRMLKVLRISPWTRDFIPSGSERHDSKKDQIIFRHMSLFTGGANEGDTQEMSITKTMGDEAWEWEYGIIGHLLARHHDRWNRKNLLQSQGGEEGTEWHEHCKAGKWHDAHHACPACGEFQSIVMDQLTGDKIKDENDEYDWPKIYESIRWNCKHCEAQFEDTDANRRQWAKEVKPVWNGQKHVRGRYVISNTFMTVWTKSWASVFQKWIIATDELKRGNVEMMRQFVNKVLGQFWLTKSETPTLSTGGESYSKKAHHEGEEWEGEHFRFMTIDAQKGHFWVAIRAWKHGSASRLLWEGKVETWQGLFDLQSRYGIENRSVFIDCRYQPDQIAEQISRHCGRDVTGHWQMTMGDDNDKGYLNENRKTGKKVYRIFSKYQNPITAAGTPYRVIHFSNLRAKDALAALMEVPEGHFGTPIDVSKHYLTQMSSEMRKERAPGKWRWEKIKDHFPNHLWDCEVLGIVGANIRGVLKSDIPIE